MKANMNKPASRFLKSGFALVAGALLAGTSAGVYAAQSPSPVGTWDFMITGGGQRGMAFLTFTNDGTFFGYELQAGSKAAVSTGGSSDVDTASRNGGNDTSRHGVDLSNGGSGTNSGGHSSTTLFGLSTVSGPWWFDANGRVVGSFTELVGHGGITTNSVAYISAQIPYVVQNGAGFVDYTSSTNLSLQVTNFDSSTNNGLTIFTWHALGFDQFTNIFSVAFQVTSSNVQVTLPVTLTNSAGAAFAPINQSLVFSTTNGPLLTNAVLSFLPAGPVDVTNTFTYTFSVVTSNTAVIPAGLTTNAISFFAKVSPGRQMVLKASTSYGKAVYTGIPLQTLPDISGNWSDVRYQGGQQFAEQFTLAPFDFPNVYMGTGSGPGYTYRMGAMLSARKRIGFVFATVQDGQTDGTLSATLGPVSIRPTAIHANTTGVQESSADVVKVKASLAK